MVAAALWQIVLGALAPNRCSACEAVTSTPLCPRCQETALSAPVPGVRPSVRGIAAAAFEFEGPVREAMHRGKYRGDRPVLRHLAGLAVPRLLEQLAPPQALVPVPLGARRRRARGYNQAEVVAGELAAHLEVPMLAGLARIRETEPQTARDEARRRHNVAGSFEWPGEDLAGARLWLVDDVLTTGATADAAASALARRGAGRIDVAVIAGVS